MRIAVDASIQRAEAPFATGVERIQRRLVPRVAERLTARGHELVTVAPSRACAEAIGLSPAATLGVVDGPTRPWVWRDVVGVRAARREGCKLWWSPVTALPLVGGLSGVATVHDVPWIACPEPPVGERGVTARARLAQAALGAWRIVVPSRRTADDVVAAEPRSADRLRVVPWGVSRSLLPAEDLVYEPPLVLCVGALRAKKNLDVVFDALQREELASRGVQLQLIGPDGGAADALRARATRDLPERVFFTGPVDGASLATCLTEASVVVVSSWLEGFGLVGLEAMAAGVPVVVSEQAWVDEACGDAARRFDGRDAASLARAIVELVEDDELRREHVEAGRRLAAQRTLDASADALTAVLLEHEAAG